ncbi:MAG: substrate-binding domain-containing protein [Pirellulales bacterium]|nr:substrate-binding domain-containing protein [Pirellulales bacterium]
MSRLRQTLHTPHVLLLIETSRAYGRGIVEGIARYSLENGPWSIQFEDRGLDPLPPAWLKEWRGQGIIARSVNKKLAQLLWSTRLPLVELHGDRQIGTAEVTCDDAAMGRMAVEHLFSCGLRQFAFFTYGEAWWTETHRGGFTKALRERGYGCHIYQPPRTPERAVPVWHERQRPRLIKWVRSLPRPIGVYTAGDIHAVRLLDVCRELNLAVPEEIAILSIGNDPVICETVRPTLSSLDLDARRIGYEAAKLLDRKMAGNQPRGVVYSPPSHVAVRQSTNLMIIPDADVVQAMRLIREYACKGLDVSHLAKTIGLSRRVLERRFQEHLQRTPKKEIIRVRIERAKTLLAQTDKLVEQIARLSGFTSVVYFSKAFRREMGMTPRAYRRKRRISRDWGEPLL